MARSLTRRGSTAIALVAAGMTVIGVAAWAAAAPPAAAPRAPAAEPAPPAPAPAAPAPAPPASAPATAAPAPAAAPSPVGGMRNKISAGDLLSAESILETHRAEHGEDPAWLSGLSWLARGALLLGDFGKAEETAGEVRRRCAAALAKGVRPGDDRAIELALGAAIEVEAQLRARRSGPRQAAARLQSELETIPGPVALRSRLYKRINMLTLAGQPAPELAIEDFVGEKPPSLASLRGRPVVLFLWAEWCGDCRAQAATLARARQRHAGAAFVTLTRYYDPPEARAAEKERVAQAWKTIYAEAGPLPIVISTASMERYGGSSTPTFVFLDRGGVVRDYTPTRLTDAEFDRMLGAASR